MAKAYKEKECEICGVWFTPHTAHTKYCPECRNHSDQKRRNLEKQVSRNIQIYGVGIKKGPVICTCAYCGKEFPTYSKDKDFCSNQCASKYRIEHTFCAHCKKPMTETDDIRDMQGKPWFCSEECREASKWDYARSVGVVKICPNCGKEHIKNGTYCSMKCYREFIQKEKEKTKHLRAAGLKECPVCGKTFRGDSKYCSKACERKHLKQEPYALRKCEVCGMVFRCHASQMIHPLCSDECEEHFKKMQKIKKEKEEKLQQEKLLKKRTSKKQKYIEENGLCSICKTSYKDCERMKSDYTASPKGSVFHGNLVIKCPKFS